MTQLPRSLYRSKIASEITRVQAWIDRANADDAACSASAYNRAHDRLLELQQLYDKLKPQTRCQPITHRPK